jgi:hypothetical protein
MKARSAVIFVLAIATFGLAQAAPAAADPNGDVLELECDRLGTLEVVVFSNGPSSPGLVVGSNQVLIPYELHLDGSFTPNGGEPETFTEDFARAAPRHARTDHCTFHDEGSDEFGSFEVDGEVFISYTPIR